MPPKTRLIISVWHKRARAPEHFPNGITLTGQVARDGDGEVAESESDRIVLAVWIEWHA